MSTNTAVRLLLLFSTISPTNVPPFNTFFWIANTGKKFITNTGQRIVFNPAV